MKQGTLRTLEFEDGTVYEERSKLTYVCRCGELYVHNKNMWDRCVKCDVIRRKIWKLVREKMK